MTLLFAVSSNGERTEEHFLERVLLYLAVFIPLYHHLLFVLPEISHALDRLILRRWENDK